MARSFPDDRKHRATTPPIPAGGMASPPHDPPAASPSPLRGQEETNCSLASEASPGHEKEDMYAAAFQFGWQSYLQYGRNAASEPLAFEKAEPQLEQRWGAGGEKRQPWQAARDAARDAWNQVQEALADGSQPKTGAR